MKQYRVQITLVYIFFRFGLLQIFLKPRCSSFVKRDKVSNDEALIVDTQLTAAVSFSYCASVPGLHCIRHLSQGFQSLFMPATMVEFNNE